MTAPIQRYFIVRPDILEVSKTQDLESTEFPVLTHDMLKLKGQILQFAYKIDHIIYLQDFWGSNEIDGFHPSWIAECRYFKVKQNAKQECAYYKINWNEHMDRLISRVGAFHINARGNTDYSAIIFFGRKSYSFPWDALEEVFLPNISEHQDHILSPKDLPQSGSWPKIVAVLEPDQMPIPRMVEVRDREDDPWQIAELLADLSEDFEIGCPYICRHPHVENDIIQWTEMREIPKTRSMTPLELLNELRTKDVVWSYDKELAVTGFFSNIIMEQAWLCYGWTGTAADVWIKAEVPNEQASQA